MNKVIPCAVLAAGLLVLALPSCGGGGGSSNPGGPSSNPSPNLVSPVATTTITITAAGVSPNNIVVAAGATVTFVNQSPSSHEMSSDPHPTHTSCPAINQVGVLAAGQSRATAPLPRGTCGYHDHGQPSDLSLRGQIIVQ
jgi:hypothetical protein